MTAATASPAGPQTETLRPVLLAASHGTDSPAGRRAISALVDAVALAAPELQVRAAFVDVQQPDVPAALSAVVGSPVRIVPLLLSAGFHVHVDLADAAGSAPDASVAAALGPDMRLVQLLVRRIKTLDITGADSLILAAAGSTDERAVADCRLMSRLVGAELGHRVEPAFVSAAEPRLADAVGAARGRTAGRVIVITYLLAPGYFAGLVERCRADVIVPPLLTAYQPPAAELVDLVLDRYRAA